MKKQIIKIAALMLLIAASFSSCVVRYHDHDGDHHDDHDHHYEEVHHY